MIRSAGAIALALVICSAVAVSCRGGDGGGEVEYDECGAVRSSSGSDRSAIVNGQSTWDSSVVDLTDGQALAVGAFLTYSGGQWFNVCTATLIAPSVVLSAAHCVVDRTTGGTLDASMVQFAVGPDAAAPVHSFRVAEIHRNPAYSMYTASASGDVSILILAEDATAVVPNIEPIPVNCDPLSQALFVGRDVQNVGFGSTDPYGSMNSRKYWTVEETVELTSFDYTVYGHGISAVCGGDSGGPSLWTMPDGVIRVVGTVSWGDPSCVDYDHFARADHNCSYFSQFLEGCGAVTSEGSCEGDTAVYCDGGTIQRLNCAATERQCGENSSGQMRCVVDSGPVLEGCGTVAASGDCSGTTARWCANGTVYVRDCGACGQSCGWNSDVNAFYCL